jgi:deazaflavin-dependent oxidoreductase (nitroreductase family)
MTERVGVRRCLDQGPAVPQTVAVSRFSAAVRRLGHQRWFARFGRGFVPVDRWLFRRTNGRFGALGMQSMLLTTTGRHSGEPRVQPLLYARDGDGYVVVGSNWGQPQHPAWSANLLANPAATVTIGGTVTPVHATLTIGPERDRLWALLVAQWPAYETYRQRAGRELRVFLLRPA